MCVCIPAPARAGRHYNTNSIGNSLKSIVSVIVSVTNTSSIAVCKCVPRMLLLLYLLSVVVYLIGLKLSHLEYTAQHSIA
jgi:hypothetical protein